MKLLKKSFKKNTVTAFISVCLVSSFATIAVAAINANLLNNRIGNELQASFSVIDPVDTVVLSWDEEAMNTALGSYNLTKDAAQTVTYYVSPGADNDSDLTLNVLLKVPAASADALQSLKVEGEEIASAFHEDGFDYYVLKEGLEVESSEASYSDTFEIAFSQATAEGSSFSASLIAVKEEEEEEEEVTGEKTVTPSLSSFYKVPYNPSSSLSYWTGESNLSTKLFFYPAEATTGGVAVVKLGDGITALDIAASSYTYYGTPTITDLTDYYDASTHTLTLPVTVPSFPRECYLDLVGLSFNHTAGDYSISLAVDQDGEGTDYSISDEAIKTISIQMPPN